jgi:hypothetical protein
MKWFNEIERAKNRTKSQVRAKVEHVIGVIKRIFGFSKVRYRGLARVAHHAALGRWGKTPAGRALYGLRKQTVEPIFGIFRQFLLRGKAKVSGEWQLVSVDYNLRRLQRPAAA